VYAECYQTIHDSLKITSKAGEQVMKLRVDYLCDDPNYGKRIMNFSKKVLPLISDYTKTPPNNEILHINVTTYEPEGYYAYNYGDGNISIKRGLKSDRLNRIIIHELAHEWAIFNSQWLREGTSDLILFNVLKTLDRSKANSFYVDNLYQFNKSISNDTLLIFCDSQARCFSNETLKNFSYAKAFIFLKKIEDDFGYEVIEKLFEEINLNNQTYWNSANFQMFLLGNTNASPKEIDLYFNGWVFGNTKKYSYRGEDVNSDFIIKKLVDKWNTDHLEIWTKGKDKLAQAIKYTESGEYALARKLYSESSSYLMQVYDPTSWDLLSKKAEENYNLFENQKKKQREEEAKKQDLIWKIKLVSGFLLFLVLAVLSIRKPKVRPFFFFYLSYVFFYFNRHTGWLIFSNVGYVMLFFGIVLLLKNLKRLSR
jgi:hypothetical protein